MRYLLLVLVLMFSVSASAICLDLPKPGLTTDEVLIQTNRVAGIDMTNIVMAYPTADPSKVCCTRAIYDRRIWQQILDQQIPRGTLTLTQFVGGITVPGGVLTAAEQVICQAMTDRILPPAPRVIRNSARANGARPMFTLDTAGLMVNLKTAGTQVYVEMGTTCERSPVVSSTTAGLWLYTTNLAGVRGIALCRYP